MAHHTEEGAIVEGGFVQIRALASGKEPTECGQCESRLARDESTKDDAHAGPKIGETIEAGAAKGSVT
jgi:hypothetical protein